MTETQPWDELELTPQQANEVAEQLARQDRLNNGYFDDGFKVARENGYDPSLNLEARFDHAKAILAEPYMRYPWEVGWAIGVLYHLYLDKFLNRR
jgi:hypothetical protein